MTERLYTPQTPSIPHPAFPSIPRLKRGMVITEKIDGTNALIHIDAEGNVFAGSRNRWITPEADNFGFARWVQEHADDLRALGEGNHYGEWYGAGIQRRYGLDHKRFALFNVGRWNGDNPPPECCWTVPVMYTGDFGVEHIEYALEFLRQTGSRAVRGYMNPEGIVVYLPHARQLFKVTLDGDGHKGAK